MFAVLLNSWPLLLGMGLIMLGNGLQGSLLGIRASLEGFDTSVTGIVMSGYYVGLILGCWYTPKMVSRVGHIRIFGALASLASTAILIHALFVNPVLWWGMRVVTGFAFAGIYVVAESWLNDGSDNESRGQLLSIYMIVSLGGMAGGQILLNAALPSSYELFVLVSLLVSLALIPILITATKAPRFDIYESVSIFQLYRVAPLGIFGMFISGMTMGAIFGMGAVYATEIGMSVQEVSFFMGYIILGGFIFQYPLGWLSDRFGRRSIIILSCIIGCIVAFLAMTYSEKGIIFFAITTVVGGLIMPLYSLCGAQTNDYLTPQQMVAASGTLLQVNAIGAVLGSPVVALMMDFFGPFAFFGNLSAMMGLVTVFALWMAVRRPDIAEKDRGEFVVMAPTPLSVSLNLNVDAEHVEAAASEDAEAIQASFEELSQEFEKTKEEGS